ncbi:MAG: hypothetical protein WB471_12180, partial [Nocardioides sp.]
MRRSVTLYLACLLAAAPLTLVIPAGAALVPAQNPSPSQGEASRPMGNDAVTIARDFVRSHAGEYGLGEADVKQLAVSSVVPSEGNGLTHVYLQQRVESIDVSTAILNVAVTAQGEVLRVASSAVASAVKRANSAVPQISDEAAARDAAKALGLQPTESFASSDAPTGPDKERTLGDGGISNDPITARLVYQE